MHDRLSARTYLPNGEALVRDQGGSNASEAMDGGNFAMKNTGGTVDDWLGHSLLPSSKAIHSFCRP